MEKFKDWSDKIPFVTRLILGLIFISDSMLKLIPDSAYLIKENVLTGAYGTWSFVYPWVAFWANFTANNINFFVFFAIIVEFLIGLFLILGLFKKFLYIAGAVYSIAIWLTISQFGGPYIPGTLDIGATPFYFLLFLLLIFTDRNFNTYDKSLDKIIKKKHKIWQKIAYFKQVKSKNEKTLVFAVFSIAFGALLAINASLKLVSGTASNVAGNQLMQLIGEPKFLIPFFLFWDKLILPNIHLFLYIYAFSEFIIAILLIFGLFRKWVYLAGIIYSLFSWSVIQGFGGPFFAGVTDLAAGPLYVLIFLMFIFYNSNLKLLWFYTKK